jgi:hypothetical protein
MPLMRGNSPKAFRHNVAAEMRAGKPQKQAVAIAYSERGRARCLADCAGVQPHEGDPYAYPPNQPQPELTARGNDPDRQSGLTYQVEHYDGTNVRIYKPETTGIPTHEL